MSKKILSIVLSIICIFTMSSCSKIQELLGIDNSESAVKTGDVFEFGTYEQDGNKTTVGEDIEWCVIEVKDGKALMLSKYVLDCRCFHEKGVDITWETSDLRLWLNDDFYDKAFDDEEKKMIIETSLKNPKNSETNVRGSGDTKDKVFCLSLEEVDRCFENGESMLLGKPTKYAKSKDIYMSKSGNTWWWLRTSGAHVYEAAAVAIDGSINEEGIKVNDKGNRCGVRPAVWVKMSDLETLTK